MKVRKFIVEEMMQVKRNFVLTHFVMYYGVEFNCDAHQASDNDLFNPFGFIGRHC